MVYIKRDLEDEITKWFGSRECLAIRGPRQSGKTTLLERIKELLKERTDQRHIIYISLENDIQKAEFERDPRSFVEGFLVDNEKHYFLIDEVQYLGNAGRTLKFLFDTYKERVKFIITGSSSLDIRDIGGCMVGRILFFELLPFSFSEFLAAKDERLHNYYIENKFNFGMEYSPKNGVFLEELTRYLMEYLKYGGYPRIVSEENIENKIVLLKNLFSTYIEKDVLKSYGPVYWKLSLDVLKYLSSVMGNTLNVDHMCKVLKIDNQKAVNILSIFEETYIIKLVRPFYRNINTELRKAPKVFFLDNGFRNLLFEKFEFSPSEEGHILENYIFSQLGIKFELKYWRTTSKAEIDFIVTVPSLGCIPLEIKITPKVTRAMRSFITTYSPDMCVLASFDTIFRVENIGNTKVFHLPLPFL